MKNVGKLLLQNGAIPFFICCMYVSIYVSSIYLSVYLCKSLGFSKNTNCLKQVSFTSHLNSDLLLKDAANAWSN